MSDKRLLILTFSFFFWISSPGRQPVGPAVPGVGSCVIWHHCHLYTHTWKAEKFLTRKTCERTRHFLNHICIRGCFCLALCVQLNSWKARCTAVCTTGQITCSVDFLTESKGTYLTYRKRIKHWMHRNFCTSHIYIFYVLFFPSIC